MEQIERTVFISYRRANTFNARYVYLFLKNKGFDVFLDYESIGAGSFEQIILEQIRARAHFVVILTPSALEHCINPQDWLRKEIEYAYECKRNIVPLMFEGFDCEQAKKFIPESMWFLSEYNALEVPNAYAEAALTRLVDKFLSIHLDIVLHPALHTDGINRREPIPYPTEEQLEAERLFEQGTIQLLLNDFSNAISLFTRALELNSDYAEAYGNRGMAYRKSGYLSEALQDYDRAIQIAPHIALLFSNRSLVYKTMGNLEAAFQDTNRAISLDPNLELAYINRAGVRELLGDWSGAISDYSKAIKIRPIDVAFNNRGLVYYNQEKFDEALQDFNEAIHQNPDYAEAYSNRALVHFDLGAIDSAHVDASHAIKLDEELAYAYVTRAYTYIAKGDLQAGASDSLTAIQLNPTMSEAYEAFALAQRRLGNLDSAIEAHQKTLLLTPNSVDAYYGIALIYIQQHRFADAIKILNEGIKLAPNSGLLHMSRGMVNFELGNNDAALAELKIAIGLDSSLFEAYYYRAVINNNLQQFTEGLADVEHALRLQPHSVKALYTRACAQIGLRNWKGAIESSTLAIQIDANHALSYLARYEAYKRSGKRREARKDYQMYKKLTG